VITAILKQYRLDSEVRVMTEDPKSLRNREIAEQKELMKTFIYAGME
jgi:hypothetical protein